MLEDQAPIDLHVHTICSDGGFTPREAVELAASKGLAAMAIADHDTVDGVDEAIEEAKISGIRIIPAVELSSSLNGKDVHVVGLFIDHKDSGLNSFLKDFRAGRVERTHKMVDLLNNLDVPVTFEDVEEAARGGTLGRPHIADALVNIGFLDNQRDAFIRYIGFEGPAYVRKPPLHPEEAIKLIHDANGLAILAHPGITFRFSESKMIEVMALGMDGMEVRHPKHGVDTNAKLEGIALKRGYLRSGGSDCHGGIRDELLLGEFTAPAEFLDEMEKKLNSTN